MLEIAWNIFYQTGNLDSYLLIKELERGNDKIDTTKDITEAISETEQAIN